uniref:[histone H3]-lysine(4) N-methyltransferase n=1 Tax=Cyprinus carpio TaxID=7962 RepID=A0A8C1N5S8_CYPCA
FSKFGLTVIYGISFHWLTTFLSSPRSEQLCAFCYCAGRSLLGQGDLKPFRVTPGYDPPLPQSSAEEGHDRDDKSGAASKSGRHRGSRFLDELRHVGLPDGIDVRTLFDESGQCWAHQSCALWSNFVCPAEDQSLLNVDKAIHSGSTEHCAYCKRLGASIKCCEEGCDRSYHYPCAGAAGTFQDFRRRSVLCPEHIELAPQKLANCILCDSPGDLLDQLFCTSCGLHYHGMCLDISVTPLKRAGWQCPECKVCQTCKEPGEDTKMLVCDMCDKGYHTFCLQPAMDSIPTNGWRCKNCRMCVQCGTRSSDQWHHNSLLCQNCGDQQDTTVPCLCPSDINPDVHKDLLSCHKCKRWFHPECERPGEGHAHPKSKEDHICSICRNAGLESDPVRPEGIQVEIQSHVDVEENAQPVSSDDSEPAKVQDAEPHQPVSEMSSEEKQLDEKQMMGKIHHFSRNIISESHTQEMDITMDGDERYLAKLSSLVEERTSLQQPPCRQPEGLPSVGHGASQLQLQAVSGQAISNVPSSTFIPFTPKIGMGKPAISKRKFSPGRPRVKQGAWSASRRPSSPSWSLDPTEGWDGPQSRQPYSSAAWIICVGRGSGFPSRRRPRGSGVAGRGGRGRARMKNGLPPIPTPGVNIMEPICTFKEEEENAMHSTVVIFSSTDTFTMKQDMCVVCGSFGQGVEGRLLACAQCGQCYHPFCVNIKITKVVLSKGWRCLECTVCEACGQASDPGRLLLCDNCDISYHTYCLDPPLQNVPNGSWKCKWCVSCTQCGATSAGLRCEWQNNYTQCAPCASLASCPLCQQDYNEEEIILQCRQCDRWMHASCQGIHSEEEVEKIAETSFDCNLCQGHTPLSPLESVLMPQRVTKLTRTYTQDGVCLTESGLSQLQSLANAASRRRRSKPKLKLKIINQSSVAVLQTPPDPQTELSRELSRDLDDTKTEGEMVDGEGKSDSSPEREATAEDDSKDTDPCKKRKRKPYRPGIGGFMVRQRNRTAPGRTKQTLGRKDSTGSETLQGKDESWGDQAPDTPIDEKHPLSDFPDNPEVKIRKRYRKKKTKLEEAFPTYLQVINSKHRLPVNAFIRYVVSIDRFLAELGGKDVEDLFTAVLSPSNSQPPHMTQQIQGAQTLQGPAVPGLHPSQPNSGLFRKIRNRMPFSDNFRSALISSDISSASAPAAASEVEGDSMSTAQKSTLKWEKEETLGELATVAPVLYTNVNFPNLKEEYPDWSTRVKQIAKLWRKASSQDRAPYVQKARDNRAALRINKVQMSNESSKRQPPQPEQPLEVFDPAIPPLDPELLFKDPLKHKESEHEQEWKYRQQMRQKSKQQAKIEATQKLEQVKNEQLQQQQQQLPSISQSEHDSSDQQKSPVSGHSNSGNMSPKQPSSKNGVPKSQLPGTPTSCSPDDVFLRPHPPPPSSGSQPQSPQMFSPSSSGSRPSSPWDPYTKMVGTPRPPPTGQGTSRRNSESGKSPRGLSEPIGSPTAICNDPYAKPPDTPRPAGATDPFLKPMCPPRASQTVEGRHLIGSPVHDPFSRVSVRKEAYQRMPQGRMILSDPYARPLLTPIPGSNESGSVQVFKTPMPPPQAQEQYGGMHARRASGDPFERPMMPPRSSESFSQNQQNDPYAQPPLTPRPAVGDGYANQRLSRQPQTFPFSQPGPMARQPSCNPYARAPSTPRPDYSQCDPYGQQSAAPRPSSDPFGQSPFSNPYARMPGTPRPHDPEPYSQQPQTQNRIMSPMSMDPYAQPPGTPRSGMADRFPKSPSHQRTPDSFSQPPGLPRPVVPDPHAQSLGRSQSLPNDSCAHPSRTPHPGGVGQGLVPGPMASQDPFSSPQVLMQDSFASPTKHGPQTLKHLSMTDETVSQLISSRPNQTPIHDPFEQRLRIRELILKQQQQKSAIRQDKGIQDLPLTMPPGTPQHWSQEFTGQQSEIFNRPPPPYPGPGAVRAPQRFHGPFPGDQQGHFPEGQFPRPQFPADADSNIRQLGPRWVNLYTYISPRLHQMHDPIIEAHPQMRRSMSMDLGKSIGGNPLVTPHLPPRGMHVQQHNIMGQPFIELRHRAPDSRLRFPFGAPTMQGNRMESPSQQRPPGFMGGQEMGFPFNQVPRTIDTTINQSQVASTLMQASLSLGNLQQANIPLRAGHPQIPLTRSISQPASSETLSAPLLTSIGATSAVQNIEVPLSTNEVPEEKIDTDESAVKDLEDVEVKDLVDADLENLNLDPDDGKDLDLETNDLHLDDFLTSGKFDIIAYADADLDLNEDLDLSDQIEDHTETSDFQKTKAEKKTDIFDGSSSSSSSSSISTAKEVIEKTAQSQGHISPDIPQDQMLVSLKTEEDSKIGIKDCLSQDTSCKNQVNDSAAINQAGFESDIDASLQAPKSGIHPGANPLLSSMLVNVPPEGDSQKQEHSSAQGDPPSQEATVSLSSTMLGQGNFSVQGMDTGLSIDQSMVHIFGMDQKDAVLSGEQHSILAQQAMLSQQGNQIRPLLLEEQPLLLQDLLDQERQEQQQQKQMQAMIRQRPSDSFFPNIDFDAITDPIMKAKMVALKGINKMVVQNNMGMSPMDGKPAPHMTRPNPPNCGPGFSHDAQKVQYEDWLRETQQLLQMQQKFLEEQIGAHRKSKKALSAKQRTAKKAGREFPEEDAEQLKHVTEQQGVVQKQLEQIRKQQKEHAELIEEYRVKQQQQGNMQPAMMHGMPPMQPHAGMMPVGPPMNQPMMGPMMPIQLHPGQPDATSVTNTAGWHPGAPVPSGAPQMPGVMPAQVVQAQPTQPAVARPSQGQAGGESPHVNFDDTNPFSESFQERERKERLREQQERQRVQLMKEVERQHVKHCMEQQQVPNCQDGTMRALSQMPFYNQELPQDFMQPPRMQQQMPGQPFPQQQGMQPGFVGGPSRPMMGNGPFPQEMGPGFVSENLAPHGPNFVQAQARPQRYPGPNMLPQNPTQRHQFPMEGPMPLPPNFPGPGPSLIQLYSNIIPEEKGKKKRSRKKKKDDDCESLRAPSTPRSDLTAPLTPCVSDTSSTPTRNQMVFGDHEFCETSQPGSSTPGSMSSQPHSELERQLSEGSCGGGPEMAMGQQEMHDRILSNIKLEKVEASDCHGHKGMEMEMGLGMVKVEVEREGMLLHPASQSPASSSKGEAGNELLKHLLKNKRTPPPALPHHRSEDSLRSEEEGFMDCKAFLSCLDGVIFPSPQTFSDSNHPDFPGPLLPEGKKKQRNKRAPKGGDRPAPRCKKRKKEEDENQAVYSSTEPVMTQLKQQNNLSNPPTPPASLPPTPPPVARQKLLNGFATTEELASKGGVIVSHDVTKGLLSRPLQFKAEEELLARALAQGPKTVNVPASLPTPPHNNQEELRGQEQCEDRDTPDSFVPSSSPESVVGMEISRYPDLSLVKEEPPSPALSPVIPMFPVFRGKGSEVRLREVKTEPSSVFFGSPFGSVQNGSNTGLVSIAITLKPAAAGNITDVVAAIADLIRVKIPSSYEVSSGPGGAMGAIKTSVAPQHLSSALHEPNGLRATQQAPQQLQHNHNKSEERLLIHILSQIFLTQQWCQHCKVVVLGSGVRKMTKDEQGKLCSDAGLVFCSHSCLILHSSSSQSNGNADTKASVALLPESALQQCPSKVQHQYSNNMSSLDVHCLAKLQPKPSPPSPNLHTAIKMESKPESISESHLKVTVQLKPCSQSHMEDKPWHHGGKRWKGLRWRKWTVHITMPKVATQTSESEVEELLQQLNSSLRPCSTTRDRRRCCFCQQIGDGMTDGPARLLNLDLDTWVHLNCALWSSEVYETQAGALINVELARQRGQTVVCAFCQRLGATSGCHRLRCLNIYHFTCALQAGCTFFKDKTMLCHQHRPRGSGAATGLYLEQQLRCFSVFRRVFVQRDELRQLAAAVQQPERGHTFRVGSLLFHAMGQLPPALLPTFHSSTAIFPPGYEASRLYWSMRHGQKRCRYVCSVEEHEGRPEFSIRVIEQGYEDLVLTDTTAKGVWDKVLGPVAERRAETGMLRLFPVYLKGEDLFGLTVSAVTRIAESLPGVEACLRYRFRYGHNPMLVLPLSINPSGCARSELQTYPHHERSVCFHTKILSVWSRTSSCIQNSMEAERGSSHSKHFVHSKSSQYRRLTSDWKTNVYLAHSRIQGLGLFAARDIEKQTMVIEYMGDVLRAEVAMRKELLYNAKNRPAYMFRIDGMRVIDATRSGSPARYINHSCSPNCVAEVVTFERGHKIIISAARRIERGEELCYDYKLTPVADQSKIPCHCGAANCRKWIN